MIASFRGSVQAGPNGARIRVPAHNAQFTYSVVIDRIIFDDADSSGTVNGLALWDKGATTAARAPGWFPGF